MTTPRPWRKQPAPLAIAAADAAAAEPSADAAPAAVVCGAAVGSGHLRGAASFLQLETLLEDEATRRVVEESPEGRELLWRGFMVAIKGLRCGVGGSDGAVQVATGRTLPLLQIRSNESGGKKRRLEDESLSTGSSTQLQQRQHHRRRLELEQRPPEWMAIDDDDDDAAATTAAACSPHGRGSLRRSPRLSDGTGGKASGSSSSRTRYEEGTVAHLSTSSSSFTTGRSPADMLGGCSESAAAVVEEEVEEEKKKGGVKKMEKADDSAAVASAVLAVLLRAGSPTSQSLASTVLALTRTPPGSLGLPDALWFRIFNFIVCDDFFHEAAPLGLTCLHWRSLLAKPEAQRRSKAVLSPARLVRLASLPDSSASATLRRVVTFGGHLNIPTPDLRAGPQNESPILVAWTILNALNGNQTELSVSFARSGAPRGASYVCIPSPLYDYKVFRPTHQPSFLHAAATTLRHLTLEQVPPGLFPVTRPAPPLDDNQRRAATPQQQQQEEHGYR
eukprot:GHVU01044051.1.p1 GENE.GHVU01044051.1~~GHVU01044051.1.p1  ORF type:complete len:504 (+),score=124.52 GHVU01044051.1:1817-3328(+)